MTSQVKPRLLTAAEFSRMGEAGVFPPGERMELIEGQIFEMSPIGIKHAYVVDQVLKLFHQLTDSSEVHVRGQNPVRISGLSMLEPDIALLRANPEKYKTSFPDANDVLLVIEVSDTSLEYDRTVKLPLYAEAAIPEYWIINLNENVLERYWNPVSETYDQHEIYAVEEEISIPTLEIIIPIQEFFP